MMFQDVRQLMIRRMEGYIPVNCGNFKPISLSYKLTLICRYV